MSTSPNPTRAADAGLARTAPLESASLQHVARGSEPSQQSARRIVAVDVLRGLVLMILLPDLAGGFSLYEMAAKDPSHWAWAPLAAQFQHVAWSGVALWDLVMPLFVFLVGVSMALSADQRRNAGHGPRRRLVHAILRAVTLIVLGLSLQLGVQTRIDELLPYLVLTTGLPVGEWWVRAMRRDRAMAGLSSSAMAGSIYTILILCLAIAWMGVHVERLGDYQLGNQILVLMGLAYFPAYLLLGCRLGIQVIAMVALLTGYALLFVIYTPAPLQVPTGETLTGLFAHWNNGNNVAAAFDRWFLNLLPRQADYVGSAHGYHTLQFAPMIANMLMGAMVGRALIRANDPGSLALRLAGLGLAGLALGTVLAATLVPLVKSLWSSSWAVFSTASCVVMLAAVLYLFRRAERAPLGAPWIVLGTNSMLLYVIAFTERWRIAAWWRGLLDTELVASLSWWPLLQSCLVLLTLWVLAYILYRRRIFVRI